MDLDTKLSIARCLDGDNGQQTGHKAEFAFWFQTQMMDNSVCGILQFG